jgi:uncharacterized repeat protein (TIGR01451 family)
VTYTIVLHNTSSFDQKDNPGNELTDVLSTQLTLVSATAPAGTATANVPSNTVTWNGGIVAGGSVTITITATINVGTAGQTISNQASIAFDADGNGTNEAAAKTDDPGAGGAADPTLLQVAGGAIPAEVPTLSGIGLAALAFLLAAGALAALRRKKSVA